MYMKIIVAAAVFGLSSSSPIEIRIETRQSSISSTSNEFNELGCRDILFAFARGTLESGNMGSIVGPPTSQGLKQNFGADKVATQGIAYAAALIPNTLPGGTDAASRNAMQKTLNDMASKCPDSIIVAGGYSQGAAVSHRAIESLSEKVKQQIAGVVLYGDTQKKQDNNQIPNFPVSKVDIICQPGDRVCEGSLDITPAHLTYGERAGDGVAFLTQKIQAMQKAIAARKTIAVATREAGRVGAEELANKVLDRAVTFVA